MANCPYCSGEREWEKVPMKYLYKTKSGVKTYYCPSCGRSYDKAKGKPYSRGY
jgi:rubredoxin